MKPPADGWDDEEQAVLALIGRDLSAVRARHPSEPPLDALRALALDAVPDDAAPRLAHAAADPWNRALVAGSVSSEAEIDIDPEVEERILQRVRAAIRAERVSQPPARNWWPALALAATVVLAISGLVLWGSRDGSTPAPQTATVPPVEAPVAPDRREPAFVLALSKPDVTISAASLTWRSASGGNALLSDLKGPLDAFRRDDYTSAAPGFAALTARYPSAVEPAYYLGLSQLLGGDSAGAVMPLARAEALAQDSMAGDAAWYLAVAYERSGRPGDARATLRRLCATGGARSAPACKAMSELGS